MKWVSPLSNLSPWRGKAPDLLPLTGRTKEGCQTRFQSSARRTQPVQILRCGTESDVSRQDAKPQSSENVSFLRVFAPLREIIPALVAALPLWVFRDDIHGLY